MKTAKKKVILIVIIAILAIVGISFSVYALLNKENTDSKASTIKPISGTFWMMDTTVDTNPAELEKAYLEMKDFGIDTIILMNTYVYVEKKDCLKNDYTYHYRTTVKQYIMNHILLAKKHNMKIYTANAYASQPWTCIAEWNGTPDNPKTDMGAFIDATMKGQDELEKELKKNNMTMDNSPIDGLYLIQEASLDLILDPRRQVFYKEITKRYKARYPNKKVLISPYKYENTSYNDSFKAYKILYGDINVDIIAPQDSVGSGKVVTYSKNKDQFRALYNAQKLYPTKQAWANIESFRMETESIYRPAKINEIKPQIDDVKPYVSKYITWIYPHTFLNTSSFNNITSWTKQYTPDFTLMRHDLKARYLETYGGVNYKIDSVSFYGTNLIAKTSGLQNKQKIEIYIKYKQKNGKIAEIIRDVNIVMEDKGTIYVGKSTLKDLDEKAIPVIMITKVYNENATDTKTNNKPIDIQYAFTYGNNFIIKGYNLGGKDNIVSVTIKQGTKSETFKRKVVVEEMEVIYIGLSVLSGYNTKTLSKDNIIITK